MTRHDDSYDALKASFGADLREAETRHRAGRANSARRPIRFGRLALVAATAAVALTVGALVLGGGPAERLNVIEQAQAALAPKPGIQHIRVRVTDDFRVDGKPIKFREPVPEGPTVIEQWTAAKPGRWHAVTISPALPGEPKRRHEQAYVAGPTGKRDDVLKNHNGLDDSTEIVTRIPKSHRDDPNGLVWGPDGDERLEDLRARLVAGQLEDRGPATVNGRLTRRLVDESIEPDPVPGTEALPQTFEYFVDAATFEPVRIIQIDRMELVPKPAGSGPGIQTSTWRIDFELYEHLPATAENEALLDFDLSKAGVPVTSRRYQENPRHATERHERDGFDPDEIAAARGATLTK